jgi:hypothetical protein
MSEVPKYHFFHTLLVKANSQEGSKAGNRLYFSMREKQRIWSHE